MAVLEIPEDVWTAPVGGLVRHAGHHVNVKVSESFGLREQHHVGLLTSGDRAERHRCLPEQVAERRCLLGGELIKGVDMAKRHQDEPTGETRVEVMGDAPTTVTDEPLTERCVRTGLLACITISWHRQSLADTQLRFARPLRVVAALCATDRRVRARWSLRYVRLGPFGASASMVA